MLVLVRIVRTNAYCYTDVYKCILIMWRYLIYRFPRSNVWMY